jgi:hypothetical protein
MVIAIVAALSGSAYAGTRDDVLAGIARCGGIADDHTWLNCVYGAAQPMRNQLGLPPAPASQVNLVPPASAVSSQRPATSALASTQPKESGGFWTRMLGGAPIVTNMPLTSYRFDSQGWFTITLANGQVWEQRDGSELAHWRGPASQYIASISTGAAGSYNLTIANEGTQYKVRRVR